MRAPRAAIALAIVLAAIAAPPAAAHVEVVPGEVPVDETVELALRIPNERGVPTTGVRVTFPATVTVGALAEPPPGWTMRPLMGAGGRLRGVEYAGGMIRVGGYADFELLAVPLEPGTALWRVRQAYADGLVRRWTGPAEREGAQADDAGAGDAGPAAALEVAAASRAGAPAPPGATADDEDGGSGAAIWLGVVAIALSALAALGVGLLWSSRPAPLPGDEEDAR